MVNRIIFFCITLTTLSMCSSFDSTKELSGNYFYRDEGPTLKDILSHNSNMNIYSTVIDYDYNDNFIIALQEPNYKEHEQMIAFEVRDKFPKYSKNTIEDVQESELVADSILDNSSYYKSIFSHNRNYWIISIKVNKIYGPLTKQEFAIRKKELNVPANLSLQE